MLGFMKSAQACRNMRGAGGGEVSGRNGCVGGAPGKACLLGFFLAPLCPQR